MQKYSPLITQEVLSVSTSAVWLVSIQAYDLRADGDSQSFVAAVA